MGKIRSGESQKCSYRQERRNSGLLQRKSIVQEAPQFIDEDKPTLLSIVKTGTQRKRIESSKSFDGTDIEEESEEDLDEIEPLTMQPQARGACPVFNTVIRKAMEEQRTSAKNVINKLNPKKEFMMIETWLLNEEEEEEDGKDEAEYPVEICRPDGPAVQNQN